MVELRSRPGVPAAARGRPARAVVVATTCALALHVLWWIFLAGLGGDLAAQDAWTGFASRHPASAYDFAWYGGMHPASYSLISPYVMGLLGVRATMLVVGTASAALLALLLGQLVSVVNPTRVSAYAAVALTGNAVSGRVTFGLGLVLGLATLVVVFRWQPRPEQRWAALARGASSVLLAGLATAASPVAGLFLGLVAAALWLRGRRRTSLLVGLLPLVVVLGTAAAFPFSGVQPISWRSAGVPLVLAAAGWTLLPRGWRLGRACCAVYALAVVVVWVVPSPIGTNVTRLALLFGGVALVAGASGAWWTSSVSRRWGRPVARVLLVSAILISSGWQVMIAGKDVVNASAAEGLDSDVRALVTELDARGAGRGRVEVVPSRSHGEAAALAPHVNLARGWNRQADVARNPLFYGDEEPLDAGEYYRWLRRWAVRLVVLPASAPDFAGVRERELVTSGVPYLRKVWADSTWTLYEVSNPAPMASGPASLVAWDAAGVTVHMPVAGSTVLRLAWSPWLSVEDQDGHRGRDPALDGTCVSRLAGTGPGPVSWAVLRAARPGTYRIEAPYVLPRGTPCPEPG